MARGWGNLAPHYAPPPSSILPEETRLRVIQGGLKSKYAPHVFQEEVAHAMRRFSVLVCHRRWGKTVLATKILDSAARRAHMRGKVKAQYAYIAPFLKQARRAAWPYLMTWAGQFENVKISEYNLEITYPNEAKIFVFGADNPDALRGFYFDGAVLDEVADMKPDTWETVIRPTLSDHKGWAMFIGTPKGENLFFDLHLQALKEMAKGSPLWWTKIYPIWDTVDQLPQLDRNEIDLSQSSMRPEAFRQEWGCVPPGTRIYTDKGQVLVEDVRVGDIVLSHAGRFRAVTKTFSRTYSGRVINFHTMGHKEPLTVTEEHPVYVHYPETNSYRWVKAKDVGLKDWLVRPRRKNGVRYFYENIARLLAWYVCEGSVDGNHVRLSLGATELSETEDIKKSLDAEGIKYGLRSNKDNNVLETDIRSTSFADLVISLCGKRAENKRLPWAAVSGNEKLFYDTLMLGDGCKTKNRAGNFHVYVTVSPHLAQDVAMLAGMMGYRSGITTKPAGRSVICGREYDTRVKYEVRIYPDKSKKSKFSAVKNRPSKHGVAVKIGRIETEDYDGPVYNLAVQTDNSYVANGRIVHNCDFSASCDNVLIPLDVISESMKRTAYEADYADYPLVLSVDVARHGLDSAVITARRGLIVYPQIVLKNIDNMTLAARVASEIDRRGADAVFIDGGRGEGVIDRLRQLGYQVMEVHFQGSAEDSVRYANKRIEMWDRVYDFLQAGGVLPDSPELRRELSAPTYRHNAKDQMVLESKDDIKERLGFSPDLADSLCLSFSAPVVRKDIRERQRREAESRKAAYNPLAHYEKAMKR